MARRADTEFRREIKGNSGNFDSIFEGFAGDNLIKAAGGLDIDFDALPSDNTSDSEASGEEGDTLLTLSNESQTQSARFQEVDFIEDLVLFVHCQYFPSQRTTLGCFLANSNWWLILKLQNCKK